MTRVTGTYIMIVTGDTVIKMTAIVNAAPHPHWVVMVTMDHEYRYTNVVVWVLVVHFREAAEQPDRQTDRQTDEQTNRQTD